MASGSELTNRGESGCQARKHPLLRIKTTTGGHCSHDRGKNGVHEGIVTLVFECVALCQPLPTQRLSERSSVRFSRKMPKKTRAGLKGSQSVRSKEKPRLQSASSPVTSNTALALLPPQELWGPIQEVFGVQKPILELKAPDFGSRLSRSGLSTIKHSASGHHM